MENELRLPIGGASVTVQDGQIRRFRVESASLRPASRRRVCLTFEGRDVSFTVQLSLDSFWRLTSTFQEESAKADFGKVPKPRPRS
jgi:hypothetical protein